ncbi:MAG: hypothetical protein GTO18_17250 [Anaerolineales bacterium]|nr:hypothetical protein [Anaerolineales bacterium]
MSGHKADSTEELVLSQQREHRILLIIILFALLNGLTYVFVVPPWQHYDEPTYFEFAHLMSDREALPAEDDISESLRREIASSMLQYGFYRELSYQPDLESTDPVWIGQVQTGDKPLYFILQAVPLWFFSKLGVANITIQLYFARILSLVLYISTIYLAYLIVREIVPAGDPLLLGVPALMAFLPGFVDLMTSVNNDVGATFIFSLFLLITTRGIVRGLSIRTLVGIVVIALLCLVTKNTVIWAIPLSLVAIALSLFPRWDKRIAWAIITIGMLVVILVTFSWGDAAYWYRRTSQKNATRISHESSPLGQHVMQLTLGNETSSASVIQRIPTEDVELLRGKTVTMGSWMWATSPINVRSPILRSNEVVTVETFSVDQSPSFFAIHTEVPPDAEKVEVVFQVTSSEVSSKDITLFIDGIILVEGDRPLDQAPAYTEASGSDGEWGDQLFTNIIRNGSIENSWPFIRPQAESLITRFGSKYLSPTTLMTSVLDWENTHWLYKESMTSLFQTFWGRFGWGHISLAEGLYIGLFIVSIMILIGVPIKIREISTSIYGAQRGALVWLGIAGISLWLVVLFRGFFTILDSRLVIPASRFVFPAIIPTSLFIVAGWFGLPRLSIRIKSIAGLAILYILNLASIITIVVYYYF